MTTQIETTDFIHATGNFMRSIKTITTEAHDGWSFDALQAEHDYEVAKAEAQGRIAEMRGCAEDLAMLILSHTEDFAGLNDMDDFQSMFEMCAAQLNELQ